MSLSRASLADLTNQIRDNLATSSPNSQEYADVWQNFWQKQLETEFLRNIEEALPRLDEGPVIIRRLKRETVRAMLPFVSIHEPPNTYNIDVNKCSDAVIQECLTRWFTAIATYNTPQPPSEAKRAVVTRMLAALQN